MLKELFFTKFQEKIQGEGEISISQNTNILQGLKEIIHLLKAFSEKFRSQDLASVRVNSTVDQEKDKILALFVASLAVVVISMMVLRGVVLRKLHKLNLAVKKIVDIIPFKMAYENKVITYYLGREMKKELGNMNVFN